MVLPFPALSGEQPVTLQLFKCPLDSRAGESQVLPNGPDSGPALALLIGPVLEVHVDQLGPGGQVLLIDASE